MKQSEETNLGPRPQCDCGRGPQEDEGMCIDCIQEREADIV